MADDFNMNDQADLNSTEPASSEMPELTAEQNANIESAMERFFEKAPEELEGKSEKAANTEKAEVSGDVAQRRRDRNRQARLEQQEELREEGLETPENDATEEGKPTEKVAKETKVESKAVAAETQAETPADIDPTLRYFAEAELGWSKEKIDRLVKADLEIASETLTSLAENYTNLSRQYLPGTQAAPGTQVQPPAQNVVEPLTPRLDQFYSALNDFKEVHGDELGEFADALKAELIEPVKAMFAANMVQQQELNKTEARQTFTTLTEKFPEMYGTADKPLTPEQMEFKKQLGQLADDLRIAAKAKGIDLSPRKALNQAHLSVSAPFRNQIVRKGIKEQVHKRQNAITARPTQRLVPATAGKSKEAAEEAVARFAADRGIEGFDD